MVGVGEGEGKGVGVEGGGGGMMRKVEWEEGVWGWWEGAVVEGEVEEGEGFGDEEDGREGVELCGRGGEGVEVGNLRYIG